MNNRRFASIAMLATMGVVLLLTPGSAAGQASSPIPKAITAKTSTAGKTWIPPRTADGQPDLQGVWTNNTVTPLERPKELAGKEFYTEEELQALAKQERERLDKIEAE